MGSNERGTQQNGHAPRARRPRFDRRLMELSVHGRVIKRLDIRAGNQLLVLSAFEEEDWASRIDDPLPAYNGDPKARLRDTVYSLNGGQHPHLIHFFCDGTSQGIRWKFAAESDRTRIGGRFARRGKRGGGVTPALEG